ncbi:MAG: ABC transporter permease [Actinobacteria bacterium]|nr:ABC transporter permease [Actinomycetota bacterium]NDA95053.1 ABC transporter permease [Actinomycetota bacterium]NDH80699.1 ABC transporter permease [Actinomycetota bacterium]NDH99064.1 ABC transporter permease [Actinomycetota bacterium]NDI07725.1 ABC transporter permease [Actinomycetota bacterium]
MLRFISRRMFFAILTILVVSAVVFAIFSFLPFDPASLTCGQRCTPQIIEGNRIKLGFDKPIYEQYWLFLSGIFAGRTYGSGSAAFSCPAPSFGYSFNENACVTDMIKESLPITINLAIGALIIWLAIGVGLGVLAAKFKNRWPDTSSSVFVLLGTSLPTFVTGLALLIWVSIKWKIIPMSLDGYVSVLDSPPRWFMYFILPWITLAIAYAALYTRFTRAAVLDTLGEDYIRTARAKGVKERTVLFKHTLRAVLAPIVTMAGLDFAGLIGGAIITETIFNLPGLGRLTLRSVFEFDLPVVLATTILAAVVVIVMNLIVDMLYAVLDPRVRI